MTLRMGCGCPVPFLVENDAPEPPLEVKHTVDGRNPRTTSWGWSFIPLFTVFYTSQVVVGAFFHQQFAPEKLPGPKQEACPNRLVFQPPFFRGGKLQRCIGKGNESLGSKVRLWKGYVSFQEGNPWREAIFSQLPWSKGRRTGVDLLFLL